MSYLSDDMDEVMEEALMGGKKKTGSSEKCEPKTEEEFVEEALSA